jgi:hypothetical protein
VLGRGGGGSLKHFWWTSPRQLSSRPEQSKRLLEELVEVAQFTNFCVHLIGPYNYLNVARPLSASQPEILKKWLPEMARTMIHKNTLLDGVDRNWR